MQQRDHVARPLRVGLIGAGKHASENLLPALRLLTGVEVTAVSSRSPERARLAAEHWAIGSSCSDWRELVAAPQIDAIVAAVPPDAHAEIAAACLSARKHVFVDKPPAPNYASLEPLIALEAATPGVVAFVGLNFPYGTSYQLLKQRLAGAGRTRLVRIRFVSKHPHAPRWGWSTVAETLLFEAGIHPVDMVLRELGAPGRVQASACYFGGGAMSIHLSITCELGQALVELGSYSNRFRRKAILNTPACPSASHPEASFSAAASVGRRATTARASQDSARTGARVSAQAVEEARALPRRRQHRGHQQPARA